MYNSRCMQPMVSAKRHLRSEQNKKTRLPIESEKNVHEYTIILLYRSTRTCLVVAMNQRQRQDASGLSETIALILPGATLTDKSTRLCIKISYILNKNKRGDPRKPPGLGRSRAVANAKTGRALDEYQPLNRSYSQQKRF